MSQHFDLIVVGSGPAGRRAVVQAAKLKKSVLVVVRGRRVAGVCVHTGTTPSKTLRETVLNLRLARTGLLRPRTLEGRNPGRGFAAGVCTSHPVTRSKCSNTT